MTEKQQRMQEISEKLEAGVQEVFRSGKYTQYLKTMSKFPCYSFRNTLLIYLQNPEATRVAGFGTWKSLGRSINKGEKGLQILAPSPYKRKVEITHDKDGNELSEPIEKEITIPAFKPVFVFDISQTSGKELPSLVQKLTGDLQEYEALLQCLRQLSPYPIEFMDLDGNANGYCSKAEQRIVIRNGLSQQQTIKTAIHELAHALLEHLENEVARDTAEIQAESVAYITCEHFGIDSSQYTFGYVAGWSAGKETTELQASLDMIQKMSTEIIAGIEDKLESIRERTHQLETEKTVAQIPKQDVQKDELPVIGKICFASGEEIQYTNTHEYIEAVKEELPYRASSGFSYKTLSLDPEVRKSVDDALYDLYGEENPRDLQSYKDQIPGQTNSTEQIVIKRFTYEISCSAEIKLGEKTEVCPIKIDHDKYYVETSLSPAGQVELTPMQVQLYKGWRSKLIDKQATIFNTPGLSIKDKLRAAEAVCSTKQQEHNLTNNKQR